MLDIYAFQQAVTRDPVYQAALKQLQSDLSQGGRSSRSLDGGGANQSQAMAAFGQAVKSSPLYSQTPEGYYVNPMNGQVTQIPPDHSTRNALIALGVIGTAGVLGPGGAFAGGGTTAAAGTGVGLGETGAVTGLAGSGLGTAAVGTSAVGVGAGSVGSSAIPSWLTGNVISAGIGGVTNLIGAKMQSNANRDAAEIQDRYLRDALAYEKERDQYERSRVEEQQQYDRTWKAGQYADIVSRMNPYIQAGGNAADRQAQLLGLPNSPSPNQAPVTSGAPGAPQGPSPTPAGATLAPPAMVTLRAPDGTTRDVPASEVDHWLNAGAVRV